MKCSFKFSTFSIRRTTLASVCLFSLFTGCLTGGLSSCSRKQAKIDYDADYFIGLQKLAEGKENEARIKFTHCAKNGSAYCARKSAEELTKIGDIQEKNNACRELLKKYDDADAKLLAVRQFLSSGETGSVFDATDNLDFEKDSNELIKYRMTVLSDKKLSILETEVYKWFTARTISDEHYTFYRDYLHSFSDINDNLSDENQGIQGLSPRQFAIQYRIDIYKRNYLVAAEKAPALLSYFEDSLEITPQLVSDLGKALFYGGSNYAKNANLLSECAQKYAASDSAFYFWFYAGRLYDKAGLYAKQALTCFENAIQSTQDTSRKDNAIWYLLKALLNQSLDNTVNSVGKYASQWTDPEYFDDFFENLCQVLLINGKWSAFKTILDQIDGFASDEIVAQYSYIYGRLLQEGFAQPKNTLDTNNSGEKTSSSQEAQKAFTRALNSGSSMYYKILAAYQLRLAGKDLLEVLETPSSLKPRTYYEKDYAPDEALEKLLKGYASYGFPEKIYSEWLKNYKKGISTDTSLYLADYLDRCGNSEGADNEQYHQQSIRMANRAAVISERPLTKKEMSLAYPKYFSNFIDIYCKNYDINTSIIYALVRSESFFDANIVSSAGAIGLTQLMEFTGNDIARKLKKQDYSLTDPETNLEFGTYYLAELVRRSDGSYLNALLSYNAGITRVRRWLSSSINEFGSKNKMSGDLFVETVPYEETRGYGKKLVSATVMYEWLYNESSSFPQIVQSFIN